LDKNKSKKNKKPEKRRRDTGKGSGSVLQSGYFTVKKRRRNIRGEGGQVW